MRFLIVRHGESEANLVRVLSNQGWKHPLTSNGREQVEQLARKLRHRGVAAIYTSPLRRAVESAEVLGAWLDLPYEIEPALVEYDVGTYENRSDSEAWQRLADVERRWIEGDLDERLPGGESCNDIRNRFGPCIARLTDRFNGRLHAAVVLIGHGGTYIQGLPAVLGNVSSAFATSHALTHGAYVEAELGPDGLRCVRWGDQLLD